MTDIGPRNRADLRPAGASRHGATRRIDKSRSEGAIDGKGSIVEHERAMAVAVLYLTIRALRQDGEVLPEPKCGP